jgi:LacI family transcriptional regulator
LSKRITIREVAQLAGVSTMTVSRVINRSGYISESVTEKVESAVASLGYVPNQLARGLRSQRSGTIALLVTDITNPYFTTIARGVEDAASDAGSLVLFCNTDENEEEELRYLRMLIEQRVDGILLVPAGSGSKSLELARSHGLSVVILDRNVPDQSVDEVRCDSVGSAAQLAHLLLGLGHRKFGVMAGRTGVSTTDERVAGFLEALSESEDPIEVRVLHGEYTQASGRQLVRELLSSEPKPTALFALNNFLTIGALQELHEMSVRVPEEVALVGFDDLPESMVTFPFLTVISQPAYEIGRTAVELLLERLQDRSAPRVEKVLPTEIIVRKSSGAKI